MASSSRPLAEFCRVFQKNEVFEMDYDDIPTLTDDELEQVFRVQELERLHPHRKSIHSKSTVASGPAAFFSPAAKKITPETFNTLHQCKSVSEIRAHFMPNRIYSSVGLSLATKHCAFLWPISAVGKAYAPARYSPRLSAMMGSISSHRKGHLRKWAKIA
jgi:hypothetical protein